MQMLNIVRSCRGAREGADEFVTPRPPTAAGAGTAKEISPRVITGVRPLVCPSAHPVAHGHSLDSGHAVALHVRNVLEEGNHLRGRTSVARGA